MNLRSYHSSPDILSKTHPLCQAVRSQRHIRPIQLSPRNATAGRKERVHRLAERSRSLVLCTPSYEPGAGTSFVAGVKRCSGEVLQIPPDRSSVQKVETAVDTVPTLSTYADAIVRRDPAVGSAQNAARSARPRRQPCSWNRDLVKRRESLDQVLSETNILYVTRV